MSARICTSDSLIGSLCREAASLRAHACQIRSSAARCRDPLLLQRLTAEEGHLQRRRHAILHTARGWERGPLRDSLALAFLIELCRRPPCP